MNTEPEDNNAGGAAEGLPQESGGLTESDENKASLNRAAAAWNRHMDEHGSFSDEFSTL